MSEEAADTGALTRLTKTQRELLQEVLPRDPLRRQRELMARALDSSSLQLGSDVAAQAIRAAYSSYDVADGNAGYLLRHYGVDHSELFGNALKSPGTRLTELLSESFKEQTAALSKFVANPFQDHWAYVTNAMAGDNANIALKHLRTSLFKHLDESDWASAIEKIAHETPSEELEAVGHKKADDLPDLDPVLEFCYSYAARVLDLARARLPELSDLAIDGANRIAAASLYIFMSQLPSLFLVIWGIPGFMLGSLLAGTVHALTPQEIKELDAPNQVALGRTCPTCAAPPEVPCVTVSGNSPGTRASSTHKPRLDDVQA